MRQAVELARNLGHPFSLAAALTFVSWYHQDRGDWQVVCTLTEEALVISARYDFADWTTLATIIKGFAEAVLRGDGWDATEVYQSLDDKHRQLSNFGRAYFLAHLAEVLGKRGRRDEVLDLIDQTQAFIRDSGEQQWHAEVIRVRGDLLLAAAVPTREVEVCYQTALSIARSQQAKSLELRAATSLARLWQQQDKRQDAVDLLAPVYNWFTEGSDTADLQNAKALLGELR